jgi:peptide/nickel transport system permease protein
MMLNDARDYVTDAPWLVFFPAAAISAAVLSVNFLADGLRDALDPRYRTG